MIVASINLQLLSLLAARIAATSVSPALWLSALWSLARLPRGC